MASSAVRITFAGVLVNVARHALPLISLYLLHGSIANFLLLTAFNLALGLMFIVGATRDTTDPTAVDPRSRTLLMRTIAIVIVAAFLAFVSAFVMLPILVPALALGAFAGIAWSSVVTQTSVWLPAAGMALLAAVRYQGLFDARTTAGAKGPPSQAAPVIGNIEEDRRRSLADYAAQVTLIGTYIFVCFVLVHFGGRGVYAFPPLYTAMLVFYDTRPDLARRIFPELWQRT